jgi:hypothetical protein
MTQRSQLLSAIEQRVKMLGLAPACPVGLLAERIGPIVESARLDALDHGIEFRFVDQKREVT